MMNIKKIAFLIFIFGGIGQSISSTQIPTEQVIDKLLALKFYEKGWNVFSLRPRSVDNGNGKKMIIFPSLRLSLDETSIQKLNDALSHEVAYNENLADIEFKTYGYNDPLITVPVTIQKKAPSLNCSGSDWFEIEAPKVSVEIWKGSQKIGTKTIECNGEFS